MVEPFTDVETARQAIESFEGSAEELFLPIAESLLDPMGIHMAILVDAILARGWEPDGFDEKVGHRVFRYKESV